MKHLFFLTLCMFSYFVSIAQFPTRGEIFDFEIGDEFHYEQTDNFEYSSVTTRHFIIDKQTFGGTDSVYYEVRREQYTAINPPNTATIEYYKIDTIAFKHKNLLDTFEAFTCLDVELLDSCELSKNMVESEFCELEGFRYIKVYKNSFYTQSWDRRYAKGLGLYYRHFSDGGEPSGLSPYEMIYFKKGTEECGTPDYSFVSTYSIPFEETISIYPNPSSGICTIEVEHFKNGQIQVFNAGGQMIVENHMDDQYHSINLTDQPPGVYFLKIEGERHVAMKRLIKH